MTLPTNVCNDDPAVTATVGPPENQAGDLIPPFDAFPYYKLTGRLATGQRVEKLFGDRDEASQAFTLVSRCRCLDPFGAWYSDAFFLRSLRQRFPDATTHVEIARIIYRDFDVPPLTAPIDPFDFMDDRTHDPPLSLVLTRHQGEHSCELEQLSESQLRELADRWDARVEYLEPVAVDALI